jgi:transmembrane sensor
VELSLGAADFQVDKRASGAGSTFVHGPQGAIEIIGTRFSVVQGPDGGSVRLDEGGIRFHAPDGRVVTLAPGEALGWPLPARQPTDKPAPRTPPSVAPRVASPLPPLRPAQLGDDAMLDRIASRRARGEYRELAADLAAAMERERRPLTRERLSFELGTVLSFHLDDVARACAHWATHLRTFGGGRYVEEVSDAQKVLGCNKGGGVK